jgi:hypothetical protein
MQPQMAVLLSRTREIEIGKTKAKARESLTNMVLEPQNFKILAHSSLLLTVLGRENLRQTNQTPNIPTPSHKI